MSEEKHESQLGTAISPEWISTNNLAEYCHVDPNLFEVFLLDGASVPVRKTKGSAGYDLYCYEYIEIHPGEIGKVRTGIKISIPIFTCGRISPRSGFTMKNKALVVSGTIDADYTGEVCIMIFNLGNEILKIEKNTRIAQLVLMVIATPDIIIAVSLNETARSEKGFGSTGSL
uniref:dUTP diphosphatase n=1 Tax=Pithovirus LCPAC404 TaxID=2506597 RepID=A0A481ZGD4_9VIRU|nr:MAG: dUTP diphosphatase [Pithovirus LCPAC404]